LRSIDVLTAQAFQANAEALASQYRMQLLNPVERVQPSRE
jgi:hypothetical protein